MLQWTQNNSKKGNRNFQHFSRHIGRDIWQPFTITEDEVHYWGKNWCCMRNQNQICRVMDPEIQFPCVAHCYRKQLQESVVHGHCNLDQIKSHFLLCEERHRLEIGHQKKMKVQSKADTIMQFIRVPVLLCSFRIIMR